MDCKGGPFGKGEKMYYQSTNSIVKKHHDIHYFENMRFERHLHHDLELVVPLYGTVSVTTEAGIELLTPGNCALILSNQMHAYETVGSSGVIVHVFSPDTVGSFSKAVSGRIGTKILFPCRKSVRNFYLDTLVTWKDFSEYTLKGCLYLFLEQYLSAVEMISENKTSSTLLASIFTYISAHFTEKITLKDVAAHCGYSAHYLSRIFSSSVGINFKRVVNGYRLDYARQLLQETTMSVTEIALASGFGSVRNFNRAFADEYSELPRHRCDPHFGDVSYCLPIYKSNEKEEREL